MSVDLEKLMWVLHSLRSSSYPWNSLFQPGWCNANMLGCVKVLQKYWLVNFSLCFSLSPFSSSSLEYFLFFIFFVLFCFCFCCCWGAKCLLPKMQRSFKQALKTHLVLAHTTKFQNILSCLPHIAPWVYTMTRFSVGPSSFPQF